MNMKGIESKLTDLAKKYEERNLLMLDASRILGYDITFSNEEILKQIEEELFKYLEKQVVKELFKNGWSKYGYWFTW